MELIDFSPAMHGHFLEYVVNRYIYNAPAITDPFDAMGTMDGINHNTAYSQSRMIVCSHYTSKLNRIPKVNKVIFIKHSDTLEYNFILLVNLFFKAGIHGINATIATRNRLNELKIDYKNDWYDKLQNRQFLSDIGYNNKIKHNLPTLNVEYSAFFELNKFIITLEKIGKFLNYDFKFDDSLVLLWDTFILKNQGYALYCNASDILNNIVRNNNSIIDNNWMIHAYLNLKITEMFNIWDGDLFLPDNYPLNARDVYSIIQEHIMMSN